MHYVGAGDVNDESGWRRKEPSKSRKERSH